MGSKKPAQLMQAIMLCLPLNLAAGVWTGLLWSCWGLSLLLGLHLTVLKCLCGGVNLECIFVVHSKLVRFLRFVPGLALLMMQGKLQSAHCRVQTSSACALCVAVLSCSADDAVHASLHGLAGAV